MTQFLFIGVDGGATKCIVRVEDEQGQLLGRETSGVANIRISVEQAWQSIHSALTRILQPLQISLDDTHFEFHAGMGLAGCEVVEAYQAFIQYPRPFQTLIVVSDAYTACLGAHGGEDGAIIIAGTGVVGMQIQAGKVTQVGGWGFPHDDEGGGAWLGLQAIKVTLQYLDGRQPYSHLAQAIYAHFKEKKDQLVAWANQANSTQFAELAPFVIQQANAGDVTAIHLLQQAAQAINQINQALRAQAACELPCAFLGGLAPYLLPYLDAHLQSHLTPCLAPPDAGAVLLVRQFLANKRIRVNE